MKLRDWIPEGSLPPPAPGRMISSRAPEGDPRTLADRQGRERAQYVSPAFDADAKLGAVTRIALAGAWIAAVDDRDSANDTARMPETLRLMGVCVQSAARGNLANALDAANSAAACAPDVQELQSAVLRITKLLG
ncbi:MAG: hypothetical protein BWY99_00329 [Synergistetes bacterium ADurb.BinA166]|nr:MAG: hypothetical protein BWY99_00329 [Synergistetes bacterium ADurb.BinA166]